MIALKRPVNVEASAFKWSIADKLIRTFLGFYTFIIIAKALGVEGFGIVALASGVQAIWATVLRLGANSIVTQRLAADEVEGRAFLVNLVYAQITLLILFLIFITISAFRDLTGEGKAAYWIILASSSFAPTFVIEVVLQVKNKYPFVLKSRLLFYTFFSLLRLGAVFVPDPILWVALSMSLEAAITTLFFCFSQRRLLSIKMPKVDLVAIYTAVKLCLPVFVSAFTVVAYMRLDQVMLGFMSTKEENGILSAAVKLTEVTYFIPISVYTVLLPRFTRLYRDDPSAYWRQTKDVFYLSGFISMIMFGAIGAISFYFLESTLGPQYKGTGEVALVYAATLVFVFVGMARALHLTVIQKNSLMMYFNVMALMVNALLNWVLIPRYGALGAAIATVASQFLGSYGSSFLFNESRDLGRWQTSAMFSIIKPLHQIKLLVGYIQPLVRR